MMEKNDGKMMEKNSVLKNSAAIQISNDITLLQRRCWNVLLANAFNDLHRQDEFEIKIKDLSHYLDYNSKNDQYLKNTLLNLIHTIIEFNILNKDKEYWAAAVLLAQAEIENGLLKYAYAPIMRKRLYNPTTYAKINLSLQNRFGSKYSLALYELCLDYCRMKDKYGETPWISISNFRKLLGVNENRYLLFKDFNKFIIKKAIQEINKESDLFLEVQFKRDIRKVIAIKFKIEIHEECNFNQNTLIEIKNLINLIPQEHVRKTERLIEIKYKKKGIEYVKKAIKYTNSKSPDNYPAYLAEVLRNGYGNDSDLDKYADAKKKAKECFSKCKGSCAAIWKNYKSKKDSSCYWCKVFESQPKVV